MKNWVEVMHKENNLKKKCREQLFKILLYKVTENSGLNPWHAIGLWPVGTAILYSRQDG